MNLPRTISAQNAARIALACLDLTSLNDDDGEADIERLCERARGRLAMWRRCACGRALPRWRGRALPASIAVAAVANFPDGAPTSQRALRDTGTILDAGGRRWTWCCRGARCWRVTAAARSRCSRGAPACDGRG